MFNLNTSFFICLGITILLVGCIYLYFNSKLSEQDQKITAMFDIITTMINTRPDSSSSTKAPEVICSKFATGGKPFKIEVSDDESSEGEKREEEEEEKTDTDSDDDFSDDDSDSSSVVLDSNTLIFENNIPRFVEKSEEGEKEGEGEGEREGEGKEERNGEEKGQSITLVEDDFFNIDDIKIINFEEDLQPVEVVEVVEIVETLQEQYKKMNLGKLRSIVLEKGLAPDTSKMKKADLLKLLSPDI